MPATPSRLGSNTCQSFTFLWSILLAAQIEYVMTYSALNCMEYCSAMLSCTCSHSCENVEHAMIRCAKFKQQRCALKKTVILAGCLSSVEKLSEPWSNIITVIATKTCNYVSGESGFLFLY